jgi:hypothetical protein
MKKIYLVIFLLFITSCFSYNVNAKKHGKQAENVKNGGDLPFKLSNQEKNEGYEILFDGTSMEQWISNTNEYKLEEGCIVMRPAGGGYGNLYTKKEYEDFIFKFEFLLSPSANSGLGLRHKIVNTKNGYDGMELQILDDDAQIYKDLKPYQYHGSLYGWIPAKRGFLKPVGEWNCQEVFARGSHIKVILNGTVILDSDLKEVTKNIPREKVPNSLFYKKGHIAFLGHDSVVKFRNIRIKKL